MKFSVIFLLILFIKLSAQSVICNTKGIDKTKYYLAVCSNFDEYCMQVKKNPKLLKNSDFILQSFYGNDINKINFVISKKIDFNQIKDYYSNNILDILILNKRYDIVKSLIANKKINLTYINIKKILNILDESIVLEIIDKINTDTLKTITKNLEILYGNNDNYVFIIKKLLNAKKLNKNTIEKILMYSNNVNVINLLTQHYKFNNSLNRSYIIYKYIKTFNYEALKIFFKQNPHYKFERFDPSVKVKMMEYGDLYPLITDIFNTNKMVKIYNLSKDQAYRELLKNIWNGGEENLRYDFFTYKYEDIEFLIKNNFFRGSQLTTMLYILEREYKVGSYFLIGGETQKRKYHKFHDLILSTLLFKKIYLNNQIYPYFQNGNIILLQDKVKDAQNYINLGAQIDVVGTETLLGLLIEKDIKWLKFAVRNNADLNIKDFNGQNAFFYIPENNQTEGKIKLLKQYGANINAEDDDNVTVYCSSLQYGHFKKAELLLKYGAKERYDCIFNYDLNVDVKKYLFFNKLNTTSKKLKNQIYLKLINNINFEDKIDYDIFYKSFKTKSFNKLLIEKFFINKENMDNEIFKKVIKKLLSNSDKKDINNIINNLFYYRRKIDDKTFKDILKYLLISYKEQKDVKIEIFNGLIRSKYIDKDNKTLRYIIAKFSAKNVYIDSHNIRLLKENNDLNFLKYLLANGFLLKTIDCLFLDEKNKFDSFLIKHNLCTNIDFTIKEGTK